MRIVGGHCWCGMFKWKKVEYCGFSGFGREGRPLRKVRFWHQHDICHCLLTHWENPSLNPNGNSPPGPNLERPCFLSLSSAACRAAPRGVPGDAGETMRRREVLAEGPGFGSFRTRGILTATERYTVVVYDLRDGACSLAFNVGLRRGKMGELFREAWRLELDVRR